MQCLTLRCHSRKSHRLPSLTSWIGSTHSRVCLRKTYIRRGRKVPPFSNRNSRIGATMPGLSLFKLITRSSMHCLLMMTWTTPKVVATLRRRSTTTYQLKTRQNPLSNRTYSFPKSRLKSTTKVSKKQLSKSPSSCANKCSRSNSHNQWSIDSQSSSQANRSNQS